MEKDYIELCNIISTTLFANLFTMSKDEKIIKLKDFNYKDVCHNYILHIANTLLKFYPDWQLQIEMSLIDKIKFHFEGNRIKFKRVRNMNCLKTCNDYIKDIESFYYPGLFYMIATDYYSQGEN